MKKFLLWTVIICVAIGVIYPYIENGNNPGDDAGENPDTAGTNEPTEPTLDEILADITGDNVFVVTYVDNGNGTITATVSVAGTVSFAGFTGNLSYDTDSLTVKSCTPGSVTVSTDTAGEINFSYAQTTNYTTVGALFTVDFNYSGTVNTTLDLTVTEASNAALADVPFAAQDVTVVIQ